MKNIYVEDENFSLFYILVFVLQFSIFSLFFKSGLPLLISLCMKFYV